MFFDQDRNQLRRCYIDSWRKAQQGLPLEPIERQIAQVVAEHPEYHRLLEDGDTALARDFQPEGGGGNPFLHMGMHLALREQVATNRPLGVRPVHRRLSRALGGELEAEHKMMDCLAHTLWLAQRNGQAPDEKQYLLELQELVQRLAGKHG